MAHLNAVKNWTAAIIILILLIGGATYFFTQQSFFNQQVFIPQFGRLECQQFVLDKNLGSVSYDGQSFVCGDGVFIPKGEKCEYLVTIPTGVSLKADDCQINSNECKTLLGSTIPSIINQNTETLTIKSGKRLYLNPTRLDPILSAGKTTKIQLKATAYHMVREELGFKEVAPDCKVNSLSGVLKSVGSRGQLLDQKNYQTTTDALGATHLNPGEIVHYISAKTLAISDNAVVIQGINNNKPIYIVAAGAYYPIEVDDTGQKIAIVDATHVVYDSKIECVPANKNYCTDDAKWRKNEPVNCGLGVAPGYIPVSETKSCKFICSGSTATQTSDCVDRVKSCPVDKPFYNTLNGQCEGKENKNQQCGEGEYLVEKDTTIPTLLSTLRITEPNKATERYCASANGNLLYIGLGALIGILLILLIVPFGKKRR